MKAKNLFCFLLLLSTLNICKAQKGFIYVHLRATSEDTSVNVPFTVSGGSTSVPSFTLNDRPYLVNNVYDVGVSHGTTTNGGGDGELWAVTSTGNNTNGTIYRRAANSATWVATGGSGTSVDGAGPNQYVYVNSSGNAFFYNAGTITTIYNTSWHGGVRAIDISYGGGIIVITASDGSVLKNNGTTYPYSDSWSTVYTSYGAQRIDILPSAGYIVFTTSSGNIYAGNTFGTLYNLGAPGSRNDVAWDDEGTIYSTGYYFNGSSWVRDQTMPNLVRVTGGTGRQVWGATSGGAGGYSPARTIFTRIASNGDWLDDERVRTTVNDNSIIIPVDAGTYTITESVPSGWSIAGAQVYDPTNNSSTSLASKSVVVNVAAGEVVNVVFQNGLLIPISMKKQCIYQIVEDFGTGPNVPVNVTSYHWQQNTRSDDGYYAIGKTSAGWPFSTLKDHTQGDGTGNFMIVNASFQADEFYRKRMTNLVKGVQYELSYWVASIGGGINPNILVAVTDSNGTVLASASSGAFNNTYWKQFKFIFTATTGVGDIYIQNNANGGGGNDIALDDIAINPISTYVPPITIAGDPVALCSRSTYNLQNTITGGFWSSSTPTVASINPRSGVLSAVSNGTTTITYNVTNAIGCNSSNSILLSVNPSPSVSATSALNKVCMGQEINLLSTPSGGTGSYTYLWSGASVDSADVQNTTWTPTASGNYDYTITITDSVGCTASDVTTVNVTKNTAPSVSISLSSAAVCSGSSITLNSTVKGGKSPYTYAWTGSNISGAAAKSADPRVSPKVTGSYNLVVTDKNQCIVTKTTPVVTVNPSPVVALSNGSTLLCAGQSLALSAGSTNGTEPYSYSWTGSLGSGLNASTTENATAKPYFGGNYTYSVTVKDANNCAATASKTLRITLSNSNPPVVSATPTGSSTICSNSGATYNLTSTVTSGGTTPFTYLWTGSGITTPSAQNTTAKPTTSGPFVVSVKDKQGCVGTATTGTITVNPAPSVTITASAKGICLGQYYVDLDADVTSGTPSFTYLWTSTSGGGLSSTNSSTTRGTPSANGSYTYTVKVTDINGCTASKNTTVTKSSNPLPVISNITPGSNVLTCVGSSVNLSASVTNGTSPYTYTWSGSGVQTPSSLSTTAKPASTGTSNYNLTVSDINGCTVTASTKNVTVNPQLTVNAFISATRTCAGQNISLFSIPGGGSGNYNTFLWTGSGLDDNSLQNTTATPTGNGSYTIKVTDDLGCTGTATTSTVTLTSALTATANVNTATVCGSQTINLTSSANGGTKPYTFSWTGSTNSGLNNTTTQNTTADPMETSTYAVIIQDKNGCTASAGTPTVSISPAINVTAATDVTTICNGGTVNLTSDVSGGSGNFVSFAWTGSNIDDPSLQNTTASPTAKSSYTITVRDDNGCSASAATPTVTVNPGFSVTASVNNTNLCGPQTVSLTSTHTGGAMPFTYSWSGSGVSNASVQNTTALASSSGSYAVSVTDNKGCTASATTALVTVNAVPSITASASKTFVCSAQSITLTSTPSGGSGTYRSFAWTGSGLSASNTQNTAATPSANGTYTVVVTDNKGCTATGITASVSVNPAINATATASNTSLCGSQTINLTSSATGGSGVFSTYAWTGSGLRASNTQNTTATPVVSGSYNVTIADSKGCSATASTASVILKPVPSISAAVDKSVICATQVVSLTSTPSGGSGTYSSFAWTGSGLTSSNTRNTAASPTVGGSFSVTVTDANGCTAVTTTTSVTVNPAVTLTVSADKTFVCHRQAVNLSSTPGGGSVPFTYSWSGSALSVDNTRNTTANPTSDGSYTLVVTDVKGCSATATTPVVNVNPALNLTANADKTFVCYNQSVNLTSSPAGGSGVYPTFLWTGSGMNLNNKQNTTATPSTTGSYRVTVTDSKGCVATTSTAVVTVNPPMNVTASSDKTLVCANPATTINLNSNPTGGSGTYVSYVWSGSGISLTGKSTKTTTATPATNGVYTVDVTDDKGCSATGTTTPVNVTVLEPAIQLDCNTSQGYAQVMEVSGTPNVSYVWSTSSGGTFSPSNTVKNPRIIYYGSYAIKITDQNSCIGTSSVVFNSTSCTILSVTLITFNASKKDDKGLITWATANEINNDHFDVERSIDGVNWIKIGVVEGNKTTKRQHDYQFVDVKPLTGKNYYRMKQVDTDGRFTYSPVRFLEFNSAWNVTVFPNPVSGNYVRVNSNEAVVRVYVVDMTGQVILNYIPTSLPDGTFDLNIDRIHVGGYIIRVINEKGDIKNLKMIKGSR